MVNKPDTWVTLHYFSYSSVKHNVRIPWCVGRKVCTVIAYPVSFVLFECLTRLGNLPDSHYKLMFIQVCRYLLHACLLSRRCSLQPMTWRFLHKKLHFLRILIILRSTSFRVCVSPYKFSQRRLSPVPGHRSRFWFVEHRSRHMYIGNALLL